MKRNICALLLLFVFGLTACGPVGEATQPTPTPTATVAVTPPPTPSPTPDLAAGLTLEEKVGQLFIVGFEGTVPGDDVKSSLEQLRVGGVILFGRNVEGATQLVALTNSLKALNGGGTPLFVSVDQEGGLVERMPKEITRLPDAYDMGADITAVAARSRVLAAECEAFGFNVDFAPSLDIWSNPENTVIGKRAFADYWEPVADAGPVAAYAMMEEGVIPVVKHFPGHGDTTVDSHVGLPMVDKTLAALKNEELVPFQQAIDGMSSVDYRPRGPVPAVMVSHIVLTQVDADRPATVSPTVVNGLLREEMGFDGVIFTDDMTMGAITQNYGLGEACVMAVEAGCDVLLVCHGQENIQGAYDAVLDAVRSGRISEGRVDESLGRILALKADYGLSDAAMPPADVAALNGLVAQVSR